MQPGRRNPCVARRARAHAHAHTDFVSSDGLVTESCFPYTSGNGTAIPLATNQISVSIDAMWMSPGPPVTGGLSPVKLTTSASEDPAVRVGFYEEFANGLGPEWRAGVWLDMRGVLWRQLPDGTWTEIEDR